jgi:hypothetical protein
MPPVTLEWLIRLAHAIFMRGLCAHASISSTYEPRVRLQERLHHDAALMTLAMGTPLRSLDPSRSTFFSVRVRPETQALTSEL